MSIKPCAPFHYQVIACACVWWMKKWTRTSLIWRLMTKTTPNSHNHNYENRKVLSANFWLFFILFLCQSCNFIKQMRKNTWKEQKKNKGNELQTLKLHCVQIRIPRFTFRIPSLSVCNSTHKSCCEGNRKWGWHKPCYRSNGKIETIGVIQVEYLHKWMDWIAWKARISIEVACAYYHSMVNHQKALSWIF